MTPLFSTFLGACAGSFLNVCLFRWKNGGQVFTPSSFCPNCKHSIFWFDNIPLISFLILRGQCRFCHEKISWQYPVIEIFTSFLFLLSSELFFPNFYLEIISFIFVSFLVLLATGDIKWGLLPHPVNNLFVVAGLAFFSRSAFLSFAPSLFDTAGSFFIIGSLMFGFVQVFPQGLGGGDIKMISALAIWVGLLKIVCILVIAFGIGSLTALVLLVSKKTTRKSMMPFGPFLAFGAFVVWFWPELATRFFMGILL